LALALGAAPGNKKIMQRSLCDATAGRRARAGGKKPRQRRGISTAGPTPADQDHDALYVRHIVWIEANQHHQYPFGE
jgi:hypothetical protein